MTSNLTKHALWFACLHARNICRTWTIFQHCMSCDVIAWHANIILNKQQTRININKQVWFWPQKALGMCVQEPPVIFTHILLFIRHCDLIVYLYVVYNVTYAVLDHRAYCFTFKYPKNLYFLTIFDILFTDWPTDRGVES